MNWKEILQSRVQSYDGLAELEPEVDKKLADAQLPFAITKAVLPLL